MSILFAVEFAADRFSDPCEDPELYSPADVAAWRGGDWSYLTVSITPLVCGHRHEWAAREIPAVPYGTGGEFTQDAADIARLLA